MAQAALGGLDRGMSPLPQPGAAVVFCAYAADAQGSGNRAQIRVMASAENDSDGSAPEVADDVWYTPSIVDSTPTVTDLTGTKETGATLVNLTNYAVIVARPMAITLGDAADAATDVQRYAITLDVSPYRWLYVAAKELGDTDADQLGILGIKYNLSL
jgi:hypothetical protein